MKKKTKPQPLLLLESIYSNDKIELKEPTAEQEEEFKKFEKYRKKYFAYETCDAKYGNPCKEPQCHHSVINIENGKSIYFTCGRRDDMRG